MATPDWDRVAELRLTDWRPRAQVRLPHTTVTRSAVPCVDVHNHLGRWLSDDGDWMITDPADLVRTMDAANVATVVNLDGMWGDEVDANVERYDRAFPGRFVTFCQLDWPLLGEPDGEERLLASLDDSKRRGARGLKVWKNLGLRVHDADGAVILPDDPRVVRVLGHAGDIGLPVLIHVADPMAFFEPLDEHNERLDELGHERDWWFGDRSVFPTFDRILDALEALVVATPQTTYIGAHVGCVAEDLDRVERLLERAPNFTVDTGGRMAELGRQPRRFRALVERFPDRVLFGSDVYPVDAEAYPLFYRFLETEDESFDYAPGAAVPPQGRWQVSGVGLSGSSLEQVYAGNARRVLGL
ncbi:amidohydrolase family protein [Curtobacterium sp. MCBD17_019]|uniref:amidohydrolase family protein n=1 Tax=Curtobacterium sp. MCBD17_019 TaxID=2175669 RepID=UPI000DA9332B|nr:amidohydrolase family protein [Curtobacterium sp. MCBD17_019]PZE76728.1 amidohydrolase [Curtobacterium sp. MCBD17_019]